MTKHALSLRERFDAKWIPEPNSGCWLWTASLMGAGYGQIKAESQRRPRTAHTVAYELYRGPIPKGLVVRHRCDVRCCVNPDHLQLGTYADNNWDTVERKRNNPRRGTANPTSKLTEADVRAIRADRRAMHVIAASYGVGFATVRAVKTRVSWKHVDG